MFPLSVSRNIFFPERHTLVSYVFFLVFQSLLYFSLSFLQLRVLEGNPYVTCDTYLFRLVRYLVYHSHISLDWSGISFTIQLSTVSAFPLHSNIFFLLRSITWQLLGKFCDLHHIHRHIFRPSKIWGILQKNVFCPAVSVFLTFYVRA